MKISKRFSPSSIICDKERGIITIDAIDGSRIIINDITFSNWVEKFKGMIISNGICYLNEQHNVSSINIFFEQLINLLYCELVSIPEEEIDIKCNEILNVVSQHIKGEK